MGAAISERAAEERSRVAGKGEEKAHGGLPTAAKERERCAWEKFRVFKPVRESTLSKSVADTRRVLTWKMVGGKGRQGPDLGDGSLGTSATWFL